MVFVSSATLAQEVRRAQPVNEPPMARPVPFDEAAPTARPKPIAPTAEDAEAMSEAEATPGETESAGSSPARLRERAFRTQTLRSRRARIRKIFGRLSGAPQTAGARIFIWGNVTARSIARPLRNRVFSRCWINLARANSPARQPMVSPKFSSRKKITMARWRYFIALPQKRKSLHLRSRPDISKRDASKI